MRKLFAAFLFIISFQTLSAQNISNLRVKNISIHADSLLLDSVSTVPNSAILFDNQNHIIDSASYEIDYVQSIFRWKKNSSAYKELKSDSVSINFRRFPFLLSQTYRHKDISKITKGSSGYSPFT